MYAVGMVLKISLFVSYHCCHHHTMPVSTSIPARIAAVVASPAVLKKQKSNCTTGILLVCFGWYSALPLLATHVEHQLLKGRCVSSCSAHSCCVLRWCCKSSCWLCLLWISSSTSCISSLYETLSSKFAGPAHGTLKVACRFVVQSSSILYHLARDVGLTIVVLSGISFVTSGPSCVYCCM